MKLEIITTPNEDFKETGFGPIRACQNVFDSVQKLGHEVSLVVCKTLADLDAVVQRKPDLVILAVKYIQPIDEENIWLSEFFALNGINYTGSSREALEFDSNKELAKAYLRFNGVKTADYFTAIPGQFSLESDLPLSFPLFLKPMNAANGNGIDDLSFVTNFVEYENKILSLFDQYDQPILVEEYLNGREFTVAVINTITSGLIVASVEIVPPLSKGGLRILGEQAKREDTEEMKKTGNSEISALVRQVAIDAFTQLGARDYGRIDIKANSEGECFFMEANLVPGMKSGSSYFPEACMLNNGTAYDQVIELMLQKGLSRIAPVELPVKLFMNHTIDTLPQPAA